MAPLQSWKKSATDIEAALPVWEMKEIEYLEAEHLA